MGRVTKVDDHNGLTIEYVLDAAGNRISRIITQNRRSIQVVVDPPGAGTVSGSGIALVGTAKNLTASPANGYLFGGWIEGGATVSTDPTLAFTVSVSRTLTARFITPVQNWRQTWFGTTANTGAAAELADPNANGISNLIEYALGGDPVGASTGIAILPQVGVSSTNTLQITLTRYLDRNDITLTAQAADSVSGPWTNLARSTNGGVFLLLEPSAAVSETGVGNSRSVKVSDMFPMTDPDHPRRFLRLEVVH